MNGCPTTFDKLTLRFETALTALIFAIKHADGGSPLFGAGVPVFAGVLTGFSQRPTP
jgi:hypothetical protein